jgi:hypothetical protein
MAKLGLLRRSFCCRHAHVPAAALAGLLGVAAPRAQATPGLMGGQPEQGLLCRAAIRQVEASQPALPPLLLGAIARVESGRADPITRRVNPWPWSINAEGRPYVFDTKAEAMAQVRSLQASGVKSIDVGCLQVNIMYHPDAFRDLEEAFDPLANARYAAKFLTSLKDSSGSWEKASGAYHSGTPSLGADYRAQVETALVEEAKASAGFASLPTLPSLSDGFTGGMGGMPMRSLPGVAGSLTMPVGRFGGGGGVVPPRGGTGMAAGTGQLGRGLSDYRARPVMAGARIFTMR